METSFKPRRRTHCFVVSVISSALRCTALRPRRTVIMPADLPTLQRSPMPRQRLSSTGFMEYWRSGISLIDFDIGRPDHIAPLLGLGGHESSEIGGRARKRRRTQIGEPRFYVGFGKSNVYLLVQLVDDFGGCVPWCGNPEPITSLEAR